MAAIRLFDDALAAAFGEEQRRPWPHPTDAATAKGWLATCAAAGMDEPAALELLAGVLGPALLQAAARNPRAPSTLSYCTHTIADALRAMAAPKDHFHEPNRTHSTGGGDRRQYGADRAPGRAAVLAAALAKYGSLEG